MNDADFFSRGRMCKTAESSVSNAAICSNSLGFCSDRDLKVALHLKKLWRERNSWLKQMGWFHLVLMKSQITPKYLLVFKISSVTLYETWKKNLSITGQLKCRLLRVWLKCSDEVDGLHGFFWTMYNIQEGRSQMKKWKEVSHNLSIICTVRNTYSRY